MEQKKCECNEIVYNAGDGMNLSGKYRWHASYSCQKCGMSTEIDGGGVEDVPDEVKQFIIEKDGEWLLVCENGKEKVKFLMRKILPDVALDMENDVIWHGTYNQVLWVKKKLTEKGLSEKNIEIKRNFKQIMKG